MRLERLLQINMAALAALGALLLGMGQRSEGPPLLVLAAAALSIWLTDVAGRFQLGRRWANVLMLAAAAVSLRDLFPLESELQAIGLSWFVIYLQIILLFQKKDESKYWLLVMLSLLQVVVATLFSQGVWFGVLLAVYMLLGFSAMTLLMLYRQWARFHPGEVDFSEVGSRRRESMDTSEDWRREPPPAGSVSRWPLLQKPSEFIGLPGGASDAGVGRSLFGRLGRMGLHTLALTAAMFFAVPRFGQVAWRGALQQPRSMVGFTDEVALGELGNSLITESREEVMRVRFARGLTDESRLLRGDVYLQGAFLMKYRDRKWSAGMASGEPGLELVLRRDPPLPWFGVTRQKITIEPMDCKELFFVAPYISLEKENNEIALDRGRLRLLRADHLCGRRWEYTLGTTAIVDGVQLPLVPAGAADRTFDCEDVPAADLPNLVALGKRWLTESGLPENDKLGRVQYLERRFAASGEFQYSLAPQPRDTSIDPLEDFVTNNKKGHCEYFASALTLMLRSQGYLARMVSGFKCDSSDWNAAGRFYQVRQLHAHVWVEVYFYPHQLPKDWMHGVSYWSQSDGGRSWSNGGWLRLDPTPAGGEERSKWLSPLRRGLDWLDSAWTTYVMELDCQRQRDAIYQPIANAAKELWRELTSAERWRRVFHSDALARYFDHLGREVRWLLLAALFLAAAALAATAGWLLARLARRLWARWTGRPLPRRCPRGAKIAFYHRFERLMARHGFTRTPGQTQREFAAHAGERLAARTGKPRFRELPILIADAFYRVRFGRRPLDNRQSQTVEQALGELARIAE